MVSNEPQGVTRCRAVEALTRANFEIDAEGMLPGDRSKLAWEYATSPEAHILQVFGKRALDRLKPLTPLQRIQPMAELAIDAIHIRGNLEFSQSMIELDERIEDSIERLHQKADAILEESRNRTGF